MASRPPAGYAEQMEILRAQAEPALGYGALSIALVFGGGIGCDSTALPNGASPRQCHGG
jgi:hypothetical protein